MVQLIPTPSSAATNQASSQVGLIATNSKLVEQDEEIQAIQRVPATNVAEASQNDIPRRLDNAPDEENAPELIAQPLLNEDTINISAGEANESPQRTPVEFDAAISALNKANELRSDSTTEAPVIQTESVTTTAVDTREITSKEPENTENENSTISFAEQQSFASVSIFV